MNSEVPKIYLFCGPEGVGKTLSTFKYVFNTGKKERKKLLISNDTYHIGAERQFEILCDINGYEHWYCSINSILERQEDMLHYDDIYIDYFHKANNKEISINEILSSLSIRFKIVKILVLDIMMLLDDSFIEIFTNIIKPDEYIITFFDRSVLLNIENLGKIFDIIAKLANSSTLWISNGSEIPKYFHKMSS
jgi:flagellar biosynthesis GTPase FlhF